MSEPPSLPAWEPEVDSSRSGHNRWTECLPRTPPFSSGRVLEAGAGHDIKEKNSDSVNSEWVPQVPTNRMHTERDMARHGGRMVYRPSFHSDPSDAR